PYSKPVLGIVLCPVLVNLDECLLKCVVSSVLVSQEPTQESSQVRSIPFVKSVEGFVAVLTAENVKQLFVGSFGQKHTKLSELPPGFKLADLGRKGCQI